MKTERLQGTNMIKDKEIKAKWVAALRSGEFKQGKHYLHKGETFCCLGVLCEILKTPKKTIENTDITVYENSAYSLPPNLEKKIFDIMDSYPLMRLNDSDVTFEVIAGYIEQNL